MMYFTESRRPSPTYRANASRHMDRLAMQATVPELMRMERELMTRHVTATDNAKVLFASEDPADWARAREISYGYAYPAARLLEIVRYALPRAAGREISNRHWAARQGRAKAHRREEQRHAPPASYYRHLRRAERVGPMWW